MVHTPTPERWQQVNSILDAALELSPTERPGFLDRCCVDDAALREEVVELLQACEDAESFLEEPVSQVAARLAAGMHGLAPGTVIDRYRIVREAGRGGMGVVYLAERADGEYRKRVALKLVLRGLGDDDVAVRRFREERQILASLEHPSIARLLDGGVTPDGLPYYVMEYVEGTPMDHYCDARRLDVRTRLELFGKVCDAVHYAHQATVVHRDLKPSNILVGEGGDIKLLDFGIAKLLGPSDGGSGNGLTAPGTQPMTPEYASPEQVRGEDASVASDIYSLGVLLYRLLTGRHPYSIARQSRREMERRILETEPEPPSAVVARLADASEDDSASTPGEVADARGTTPEKLRRLLRGDLDAITLTALPKEPKRRYASAADFAADLRRYLAGEAVGPLARARSHQVRRFVRRYRADFAAALALVVVTFDVNYSHGERVPSVTPPASTVAVLPFVPNVPDSALARMGREVVVPLSNNLDGLGDIRAVGAPTAAGSELARLSLDDAQERARRLGAGAVVRGRIMRVSDGVRLYADVIPVDNDVPIVRASVNAALRDAAVLADSLTWALLRELWRVPGAKRITNPRLGGVTTHSIPALRAYLEGEHRFTQYRFRAAVESFERAMQADSTFWLAYWRYAWTRELLGWDVDTAITAAYRAHRAEFPSQERLLIEARMTEDVSERLSRARALTQRYGGYWPGWFELAELLVHEAPYLGSTLAEARMPLERTAALDRSFVPAWDHLLWIALSELDTAGSRRTLAELTRLRYDSATLRDGGINVLHFYRYADYSARHGGAPDTAHADSIVAQTTGRRVTGRPDQLQAGTPRFGFHRARIDLARRMLRTPTLTARQIASQWRAIATAWASRGAWDSALVAADSAMRIDPDPGLFAYRLATVGAWLGAVPAMEAASRRDFVARSVGTMPALRRAELAWIDGLLAVAQRDRPALARARAALRTTNASTASKLDSSLMAIELDLAGDRRRARHLLSALERERHRNAGGPPRGGLGDLEEHPYLTGVDRLTLSRWLLAAGDTSGAARVLTWHEAVFVAPVEQTNLANALLAGFAYLERARIEEARGRRDLAATHYRQFLRRYDMPVPAHRQFVDEARAAVARVERR